MNTSIIREAIGLLNSMVECGEKHSDRSREVVAAAKAELDAASKGPYARWADSALATAAESCQPPARAMTPAEALRFLFGLLDDIDTLDDACKGDDAAFRRATHKRTKRRWETGITSDGYTLDLSGVGTNEAAATARARVLSEHVTEGEPVIHTTYATPGDPEDIEALAAAEHESWSGWTKYMLDRLRCELEADLRACSCQVAMPLKPEGGPDHTGFVLQRLDGLLCIQRWVRQMKTLYVELPGEERESDRIEARKKLKVYRPGGAQ